MKENRLRKLFQNRNFKLLFFGEAVSNIGDQFTLIGLAWLMATLTGSAAAVGITLALSGFPRAILMLVSGSAIDRFSPRRIMLISNGTRFFVVLLLATLILTGTIQIWMIYTIALLFGIFDAFFIPARSSLVPHIVPEEILGIGNSLIQGLTQLSQFIGPVLAGALIGYIQAKTHSYHGIGVVMVIDALTFIVSLMTLRLVQDRKFIEPSKERLLDMIKSGFSSVWKHIGLRYVLISATLVNFFFIGPFLVGMPLIAKNQLAGAYSYGFIMSSWGIGALVGYALAGFVFSPKRRPSVYLLSIAAFMGLFFSLFAYAHTTLQFVIFSFLSAVAAGYVVISFITIVQKNTPREMMGRTMGILIFSSIGLNPVSELIAGQVMGKYPRTIFHISGVLIILVALIPLLLKSVRQYGDVKTG